jgi:nitrogen regulatory protein PII 2
MNKINQTKQALVEAGFPAFTGSKVMGRGSRPVDFEVRKALLDDVAPAPEALASLAQGPRLIAKRMISMVVPEGSVPAVVKALIAANQTGNPGDGKIFVLPVSDVARVRTGETGAQAIDEMTGR